jgi:superfamily II DNA or RNA helicase
MLPASITNNFITEMRRCGGHVYAEEQRWSKTPSTNAGPTSYSWTRDAAQGTHFRDLDTESRQSVKEFLNKLIRERVTFISYNGITGKKIDEIVKSPQNIFDNAAIVIDEVHNFVSQVIKQRNVFLLYERMMAADPRKVILLTGTPFMNSVMELPYLVNLAHGFVRFLEINVYPRRNTNGATNSSTASSLRTLEAKVDTVLSSNRFVNRFAIKHTANKDKGTSLSAVVQLTPNGFMTSSNNENDDTVKMFVEPMTEDGASSSDSPRRISGSGAWLDHVRRSISRDLNDIGTVSEIVARNKLLLPVGDAFLARYTSNHGLKLRNTDALSRRIQGTVSYFGEYDPALYPRLNEKKIIECEMSARQFDEYKDVRAVERRIEESAANFARTRAATSRDDGSDGMGAYRPRSRAVGNFVFPPDVPRPQKKDIARVTNDDALNRTYDEALAEAISTLRDENRRSVLSLDGSLAEHSPKFYRMLRHFESMRHLALVYSEFRTMEGVGLLSACLDTNGYSMIYVKSETVSTGARNPKNVKNKRQAAGKKDYRVMETSPGKRDRYMIHDNSDPDAAQIILNAFNSEFDKIPNQARKDITRITGADNNRHGELAKLLLVTKSGAEGINLKNVREVHIMEPFWNSNRIDQVVGRAVRAKSHLGLPEEERQVDQYLYMSMFTETQAQERMIKVKDGGITSDQHVYKITQQKDELVGQMQRVLKTSAVDCRMHEGKHRATDSAHRCLPKIANLKANDFAFGMSYDDDDVEGSGSVNGSSSQGRAARLIAVRIKGDKYFLDKDSNALYDYDKLKNDGELVRV